MTISPEPEGTESTASGAADVTQESEQRPEAAEPRKSWLKRHPKTSITIGVLAIAGVVTGGAVWASTAAAAAAQQQLTEEYTSLADQIDTESIAVADELCAYQAAVVQSTTISATALTSIATATPATTTAGVIAAESQAELGASLTAATATLTDSAITEGEQEIIDHWTAAEVAAADIESTCVDAIDIDLIERVELPTQADVDELKQLLAETVPETDWTLVDARISAIESIREPLVTALEARTPLETFTTEYPLAVQAAANSYAGSDAAIVELLELLADDDQQPIIDGLDLLGLHTQHALAFATSHSAVEAAQADPSVEVVQNADGSYSTQPSQTYYPGNQDGGSGSQNNGGDWGTPTSPEAPTDPQPSGPPTVLTNGMYNPGCLETGFATYSVSGTSGVQIPGPTDYQWAYTISGNTVQFYGC